MKVKIVELQNLMENILISENFSSINAKEITEVLLYAELSGKKTQGIIKFFGNEPIQKKKALNDPKIVKETKLSALLDGEHNPGILVAKQATKILINKCKENKFAIVGINNGYASTGSLGYYVNEIAKHNFIGIVMSGTPKGVSLYGSIDKIVGINPISFSFPTREEPLIFDSATSAITWYGLIKAKMDGEKLPKGVAIDTEGNLTTDPEEAMKGAIRTFGNDYKGSGFNLMVEMFTGPLVGAIKPDKNGEWYNGGLFIAIDPDLLIGQENLKKNSSEVLHKIKGVRKDKNVTEILLPGEKSLRIRKLNESRGEIEVEEHLYKNLLKLIKSY